MFQHRITPAAWAAAFVFAAALPAEAQYNHAAGRSAPTAATSSLGTNGAVVWHESNVRPQADRYGNAEGNQYDLAVDGAFDGQTVAVLHFYTGGGFDFRLPREALREKGFSVYRWSNAAPSPADLRAGLARASQLWVISGDHQLLGPEHLRIIRDYFNAGHGVYILGDNAPYYADANAVAQALLDTTMEGDLPGDRVVGLRRGDEHVGVLQDHLITTGLEHLYEGITIATVHPNASLTPLLYGSAGNLVSALYDHDGRRAIVDGGFTRLYMHWDTAGTARYVKNVAAWLANVERFGDPTHPAHAPSAGTNATQPAHTPTQTPARTSQAPSRRMPLIPIAGIGVLVGAVVLTRKRRA
jgi:hypothetical protein